MSSERSGIDRRDFFRHSVGIGAGAMALGRLPEGLARPMSGAAGTPLIITSHSNETGQEAMRQAWEILNGGGHGPRCRGAGRQRHRGGPGRYRRRVRRPSERERGGPARRVHHGREDLQRRLRRIPREHQDARVRRPSRHGAHGPHHAGGRRRFGVRPFIRVRGGGPHDREVAGALAPLAGGSQQPG